MGTIVIIIYFMIGSFIIINRLYFFFLRFSLQNSPSNLSFLLSFHISFSFLVIFHFFMLLPSFFQFQTLQKSRSKDDECFPIRSVRFLNHIIDSLFTGSSSLSSPVVALPSTLATLSLPHMCISISAKRCSTSHCC